MAVDCRERFHDSGTLWGGKESLMNHKVDYQSLFSQLVMKVVEDLILLLQLWHAAENKALEAVQQPLQAIESIETFATFTTNF